MLPNRTMEDMKWHELQKKMKETRCATNMGTLAVLLNGDTMCVGGGGTDSTTNDKQNSGKQDKGDFSKSFTSRLSSSLGRAVQRTTGARSLQLQPSDLNATFSPRPPSMTSQTSVNGLLATSPTTSPIIRRMQSLITSRRSKERTKEERMREFANTQNLAAASAFEGSEEFLLDPKSICLPVQFSDDFTAARMNGSCDELRTSECALDALECIEGQWSSRFSMHGDLSYPDTNLGR